MFFHTTERAINIRLSGDKPADHYSAGCAHLARLPEVQLTVATSRRMFSVIRSVMNFASSETGLEFNNPFEFWPVTRACSLSALRFRSAELDRTTISDSGMRLSEAIGLSMEDIRLDADIPHLVIQPHPWRTLKTRASQRILPLSGEALWAAGRLDKTGRFAFPIATAKRAKRQPGAQQVDDDYRRALCPSWFPSRIQNRLRAIECPPEIIDQLGGWALPSVGQTWSRLSSGLQMDDHDAKAVGYITISWGEWRTREVSWCLAHAIRFLRV